MKKLSKNNRSKKHLRAITKFVLKFAYTIKGINPNYKYSKK